MASCLLVLLLLKLFMMINGDLLFMYAVKGKISVCKTSSIFTIKEITIRHSNNVYFAPHYKQDLIFYAYESLIYRIHLVDENGDRKISGKGDLLTNRYADHKELKFFKVSSEITGLHVDEINNKLYVSTYSEISAFDLEAENEVKIVIKQKEVSSIYFYQGMIYFKSGNSGIFRINANGQGKIETLFIAKDERIESLTIDEVQKKLLYRYSSEVRMIDLNATETSYPVTNPRVVLSDSSVTNGAGVVAANNRVVVWFSKEQFYLGIINSNYTFIPKKSIYLYGEKGIYLFGFRPLNIFMFDHVFDQPTSIPRNLK